MDSKLLGPVIKCPKCGTEYLPCEVLYPEEFVGTAQNILRKEDGKIDIYTGENMNLSEEFTCDKCGCTFNVNAKVTFNTKVNNKHDFSSEYKTRVR